MTEPNITGSPFAFNIKQEENMYTRSDNLKEVVNQETGEVTYEAAKSPAVKAVEKLTRESAAAIDNLKTQGITPPQIATGVIEGALVGGNTTGEEIECKADKFIRLADARTIKVIKYLKLLGHLSNKAAYDFTPEQVEKIFSNIVIHFENARNKLLGIKEEEKPFSLRD